MVIIDTNIVISAIRGNEVAISILRKYKEQISISVISKIELAVGATSNEKKAAVNEVTKTHAVIPLSKNTGEKALQLVELYNTPQRRLYLPDALIAATCIEHKAALLTFNTKDFIFIKGLKLVK